MGQARTERKRAEKAERRESKAAKKQASIVEEKKRKLGNGVLAIMIFGIIAVMFASVWAYNYSQKEASVESFIANNGGKEAYGNMLIDENTMASVTADKNNMKVVLNTSSKDAKKHYNTKDGEKELKYIGSYLLGTIKPNVRGFSASVKCTVKYNDKKVKAVKLKWSEAKDVLEDAGIELDDIAQTSQSAAAEEEQTTETETEE